MLTRKQAATLQPGDKLKLHFQPLNPNNSSLHVRGWVDGMVITRRWSRHAQQWAYEVHGPEFFMVFGPYLTLRRKRRKTTQTIIMLRALEPWALSVTHRSALLLCLSQDTSSLGLVQSSHSTLTRGGG